MTASQRHRRRTARKWQKLLRQAKEPRRRFSTALPAPHDEVLAAEPAIIALIEYLEDRRPMPAQVVTRAHELITDPTGVVYLPPHPGALRAAVEDVLDILNSTLQL
jgi:hypothetical protein